MSDNIVVQVVGIIVLALAAIVGISLLMALPTFWLWNWLMPTLFGLKAITFWQALGLNLLTGMLLKNSPTSSTKSK